MDLGIAGKKAIVCAASKGLGKGCAESLVKEGVDVTICARTAETLEATADELRALGGGSVTTVACDITSESGRAEILKACPNPDILVNNAGGPPPGDFRDWDRDDWIKAVDANMLTPIFLIKATVRRHDRPQVRSHRQHHVRRRKSADSIFSACRTGRARALPVLSPASRARPCATTSPSMACCRARFIRTA